MKKANVKVSDAINDNLNDFMMEKGSHYASSSKMAVEELASVATGKIVDLGCGDGVATDYLNELGFETLGIDINPLKLKYVGSPTVCSDVLEWLEGQQDNSIENIFTHHFLEHYPEPEKILNEIGRVLEPEGYCLIIVPHGDTLHDVHFVAFESEDELVPNGLTKCWGKVIEFNNSYWVLSKKC